MGEMRKIEESMLDIEIKSVCPLLLLLLLKKKKKKFVENQSICHRDREVYLFPCYLSGT